MQSLYPRTDSWRFFILILLHGNVLLFNDPSFSRTGKSVPRRDTLRTFAGIFRRIAWRTALGEKGEEGGRRFRLRSPGPRTAGDRFGPVDCHAAADGVRAETNSRSAALVFFPQMGRAAPSGKCCYVGEKPFPVSACAKQGHFGRTGGHFRDRGKKRSSGKDKFFAGPENKERAGKAISSKIPL
ncbi:MAG: hypothetical protein C6P37_16300 [Caldibacillus debilis]|uniref:Uncharacterized protein n=1 Tax=Caldibacillus debilis TaxID=301148 RepID=A0A3E0JUV5_9BACI|nr:MAG: hypothetical protein C6P37_16300 [Caldibacillus debilis]